MASTVYPEINESNWSRNRNSDSVKGDSVDTIETYDVMGVRIAVTNISQTIATLTEWLKGTSKPRLITFTNVHMIVEAVRRPDFFEILSRMDMNCPDGMPLVWIGRHKRKLVGRVPGPELMPAFCHAISQSGYRHFFFGGAEGVAEKVISSLRSTSPDLAVAGCYTPPFRPLTQEEDEEIIRTINESNPDIVWVCLGCPKQEVWMAEHREKINARLILAVGMAFDIAAGTKKRAPAFLRDHGMEWLFRLMTDPRRLAGRYLYSNSAFVWELVRSAMLGGNSIHGARSLPYNEHSRRKDHLAEKAL